MENLKYVADEMAEIGTRVIVEPLNPAIRENAMLTTSDETMDLLNEIGHPNLGLEYDAFHMHVTREIWLRQCKSICHISATYKLQMSRPTRTRNRKHRL